MRKHFTLLILSAIILTGSIVLADVINMPGAPVMPEKPKPEYNGIYKHIDSPEPNYAQASNVNGYKSGASSNNISASGTSAKSQLDSIAMSILRDAENKKGGQVDQSKLKKMLDLGATGICPPQVVAKKTPQCPPIKMQLGNRVLSGSKCAQMCYVLNGKQHDIGYCK